MRQFIAALAGALACLAAVAANAASPADGYPNRIVKMIVPFPAGGTTDIFARHIGDRLAKALGHNFVIDNRGGAGGNIGSDAVAKADPDGYTLLVGTVGTHAINPSLYARMPYDPVKDFAPVAFLAGVPNILEVNPKNVKAKTVEEFIAEAKAAQRS
jgi:tripartite-type tricarboxylate transporter receptor subunit TctC